ncbi:uncharacterized protein LOC131998178 [Stomoxys calcitrans]|uniref:uncharacterized protein LOC131998178 n=1 Tax=Stomoxys calcitrans TaxID=35570 RepID=UPI0027E36ED5|nr:uncharacterized protein LOC131998178 [Stomoxys calcitrans]
MNNEKYTTNYNEKQENTNLQKFYQEPINDGLSTTNNNALCTPLRNVCYGINQRSVSTAVTPSLSVSATDDQFTVWHNIGEDEITTVYAKNNVAYATVIQVQQQGASTNSPAFINDIKRQTLERINTNCHHKIMACHSEEALIYAEKSICDILCTLVTKKNKMKSICEAVDKTTLEIKPTTVTKMNPSCHDNKAGTLQRIRSSCSQKIMSCNDELSLVYAEKSICNILCTLIIHPEKVEAISEAIDKVN